MGGTSTLERNRWSRWSWLAITALGMAVGLYLWLLTTKPSLSPMAERPAAQSNSATGASVKSGTFETTTAEAATDQTEPAGQEASDAVVQSITAPREQHAATSEISANGPWSDTLSPNAIVWPENSPKLTENYRSAGHDDFSESMAKLWFEMSESDSSSLTTDLIGKPTRRVTRLQGLVRLRAPWPTDAVMRVTPFDVSDLAFYFWRGDRGIAFKFFPDSQPNLWAAFEISRDESSTKPNRWGLLTTDEGSYVRSGTGMFDIRHQNGALVLARGGSILMSTPMDMAPAEVYVQGEFRLRGFSMHRSVPFRDQPAAPRRTVGGGPASGLPWQNAVDQSTSLTKHDNGSVSATFTSREKTEYISFPLNGSISAERPMSGSQGPFEVVFKIESADPGTGLFLGGRDNQPLARVGFFRDDQTEQTLFGFLESDELRTDTRSHPIQSLRPYFSRAAWIKLIPGADCIQIQVSGDGRHWGHFTDHSIRDWPGAVESIGIYGLPQAQPRTLQVREIVVNQLTRISDLKLDVPHATDPADALQNADTEELAQAAERAIVAFAQGSAKDVCLQRLEQLLAVGMNSKLPFLQKKQMLDDACLLRNLRDEATAKLMASRYEQLGWQLANRDHPENMTEIRTAWLWSPFWSKSKEIAVCEPLQSYEIIRAVYRHDWASAWSSARSAAFWTLPPNPDDRSSQRGEELLLHAQWAKSVAAERAPQLDDGSAGTMQVSWRHPLIPIVNKESYDAWAELQSVIAGGTYEDACRIVTSIDQTQIQGLLADHDDRDLFLSLFTVLKQTRAAHPRFATTMSSQFEPQGLIRVASAMNRRDLTALTASTIQFLGTDAACQAHQWLGDLALATGRFDDADEHYRDGMSDANIRRREQLEPRLLLIRAVSGNLPEAELAKIFEQVPQNSIEFNGTTMSREEFESLLRSLAVRRESNDFLRESPKPPVAEFPKASCRLDSRSEMDSHANDNQNRPPKSADVFGRQLSILSYDEQFYVGDRNQVIAFSAMTGEKIWTQSLSPQPRDASLLPCLPKKPLMTDGYLFVRNIAKLGIGLACLKTVDGSVVWRARPSFSVVSDPVIWNGRLCAMLLNKLEDDQFQVEVASFEAATGTVNSRYPLFRLRETVDQQFMAQLSVSGRTAVCTFAGTTASFNQHGEVNWIRRHLLMRKPVDELVDDSRSLPPVITPGRVIVSMPGVREVCCLNLESGRSIWTQPIPNLRGLIDVTDKHVVADTVSGLLILDAETGRPLWRRIVDGQLEAFRTDRTTLIVSRRTTDSEQKSQVRMSWFDLNSGAERSESVLRLVGADLLHMGPMFSASGKWWTFTGQSPNESKRSLCEIVEEP